MSAIVAEEDARWVPNAAHHSSQLSQEGDERRVEGRGVLDVAEMPRAGNVDEFRAGNASGDPRRCQQRRDAVVLADQHQGWHLHGGQSRRGIGPVAECVEPGDDRGRALAQGDPACPFDRAGVSLASLVAEEFREECFHRRAGPATLDVGDQPVAVRFRSRVVGPGLRIGQDEAQQSWGCRRAKAIAM